jgi:indolepyruvate ferredoxin oxidoreductase, beta subunit
MTKFDIFIIGVGGQGIGLMSETIARAASYAGWPTNGADTHGLAQRGGTVTSHVRLGENAHSSIIRKGTADLVISLERHEALRGMNDYLVDGGTLVFYNASWQPLSVRLGNTAETSTDEIYAQAKLRNVRVYEVFDGQLENEKFQNVAVLGCIAAHKLIPNILSGHFRFALQDLLAGNLLEANLLVFDKAIK